jgi:CRP-like cAMP-binding protein
MQLPPHEPFYMTINALKAAGYFSDHEIMLFEKEVKPRHLKKGDVLFTQGDVARSLFFVLQGAMYQYASKPDAADQIIDLHTAGEWFLSYQSFVAQVPAESSIAAFTDCDLLEISIESVHFLIGQSPSFLQLNKVIEQATSRLYFFDHSLTPLQKYRFIFEKKGRLLQSFPLKMIASYLKVSPETLSRVRKRFAKDAAVLDLNQVS